MACAKRGVTFSPTSCAAEGAAVAMARALQAARMMDVNFTVAVSFACYRYPPQVQGKVPKSD
jgi:hypothetical protein